MLQLGELVIATGADASDAETLAGALLVIAETRDAGKREAWAKRGTAFFQSKERKSAGRTDRSAGRSEEHTSELQSLMRISYAVFCLKKKQETNTNNE